MTFGSCRVGTGGCLIAIQIQVQVQQIGWDSALLFSLTQYALLFSLTQYALLCSVLLHPMLSYSICPSLLHYMHSSVLFSYTIVPPLFCSPTQYALLLNMPFSVLLSSTIRSPTQYALLCSVLQASWVIHVKNTQKYNASTKIHIRYAP